MNPCGYAHLKNAPCRICDGLKSENARRSAAQSRDLEQPSSALQVREAAPSTRLRRRLSIEETTGPQTPLTPAEKQRRYRQRHAERVRKMDRERKRMVRKET